MFVAAGDFKTILTSSADNAGIAQPQIKSADMINYIIRHALESESTQINDLIHLVGIKPTGLDWRRFIVAVNASGQLLACGQIKQHGIEIRELASIGVKPEYRGIGIARAVIEMLLRENPRPLYLMCFSHNGPIYKKFGFNVIKDNKMPLYFFWIKKRFIISEWIKKRFDFFNIFRKSDLELLVMKLE